MAGKPVMAVAVRPKALEWAYPRKAGDKSEGWATKQAELELSAEHPTILDSARNDREGLVREIQAKCERISGPVTLGIPAAWVLMRIVELPSGNPDELRSMVDLQVDKFSPFPAETTVVSYELLQEADGRARLLITAIQTETVDVLGMALRTAGIQAKWVDINLLGWWRLLADQDRVRHTGSQAFLLLDGTSCDMIVASAGVPVAIRSLSGLEDLPPEDAAEEIARETAYTLTSLSLEQSAEHLVVEVTVWHRGEAPDALLRRLRDQFGITAHAHLLDTLPPLSEGLARRAAARSVGTVNLAPPAWQEAETRRRRRNQLIAVTALLLGLWVAALATLLGGLQVQKQRLTAMEAKLDKLQAPAQKVRDTRERVQTLEQYTNRTYSALECLREVSDLLPPGIDLKSFVYRKGKTVEMAGEADAVTLVYDFKKELEKSELFAATELHRTVRTAQGKENFKITATLPGSESGGKE